MMWTGHTTIVAMISTTVGLTILSYAILIINIGRQVQQKKALKHNTTSVQLNQNSNPQSPQEKVYRMVLSTDGRVLESNVHALEGGNLLEYTDDTTKNIFLKVKHAAMVGDGYTTFEWPIDEKKQVCTGYATLHDGHKIHLVFQESKA